MEIPNCPFRIFSVNEPIFGVKCVRRRLCICALNSSRIWFLISSASQMKSTINHTLLNGSHFSIPRHIAVCRIRGKMRVDAIFAFSFGLIFQVVPGRTNTLIYYSLFPHFIYLYLTSSTKHSYYLSESAGQYTFWCWLEWSTVTCRCSIQASSNWSVYKFYKRFFSPCFTHIRSKFAFTIIRIWWFWLESSYDCTWWWWCWNRSK